MTEEIKQIHIVPALFIKYREDGNVLLRCLQGEDTVDRAFEPRMFKGFKDLKYVLIGVMTGVGMMRLTIADGSEWENLYHEKWSVLLK
jgi:hypothetical protein